MENCLSHTIEAAKSQFVYQFCTAPKRSADVLKTAKECLHSSRKGSAQAFVLFYDQPDGDHNMNKQKYRYAYGEFQVFGLMADQIHSGKSTNTASGSGKTHQRCFRDAPKIFPGFILVHKHKNEGNSIDYSEVNV